MLPLGSGSLPAVPRNFLARFVLKLSCARLEMEPVAVHGQKSSGPERSEVLDGSLKEGKKTGRRNREFRADVAMAELVVLVKGFT